MSEYDNYIEHNRYSNTVQIRNSLLLDCFMLVLPYCEELHARNLQALRVHQDSGRGKVSRTNHAQAMALVRRYLDKVTDPQEQDRLKQALSQAELIEVRARWKVQEVTRERGVGNVHFVKSLASTTVKRRSI